jgi:hypothetical protein
MLTLLRIFVVLAGMSLSKYVFQYTYRNSNTVKLRLNFVLEKHMIALLE